MALYRVKGLPADVLHKTVFFVTKGYFTISHSKINSEVFVNPAFEIGIYKVQRAKRVFNFEFSSLDFVCYFD